MPRRPRFLVAALVRIRREGAPRVTDGKRRRAVRGGDMPRLMTRRSLLGLALVGTAVEALSACGPTAAPTAAPAATPAASGGAPASAAATKPVEAAKPAAAAPG